MHVSDGRLFYAAKLVERSGSVVRGDMILVAKWTKEVSSGLIAISSYSVSNKSGNLRLLGRVVGKTPVLENGSVAVCSLDILDGQGIETRLVFLNKAAFKCESEICLGDIYSFQGGTRNAQGIFYEEFPIIEHLSNDPRIPSHKYMEIAKISDLRVSSCKVNVAGVVLKVSKTQGKYTSGLLGDESLATIPFSFQADIMPGAVLIATKCIVTEFKGERTLSLSHEGTLRIDPSDLPLTRKLKMWHAAGLLVRIEEFPDDRILKNVCDICDTETTGRSFGWVCQSGHFSNSCRVWFDLRMRVSFNKNTEIVKLQSTAASQLLALHAEDFELLEDKKSFLASLVGKSFRCRIHQGVIVEILSVCL